MAALKVWDGTAWQVVSQAGPPGTAPVTSVDARTGAVTLSDLYVSATDPFVVVNAWTAYTPKFATETNTAGTGMTPGAGGFVVGAYRMIAPYTMAVRMRFQWGSSGGNGGGGALIYGLPAGYSTATDTYQYMTDFVYRADQNWMYLGLTTVYPNDVWMRPAHPNAALITDVVGSQIPVRTDLPQPPNFYPNGSLGIWGVLNVQQRV